MTFQPPDWWYEPKPHKCADPDCTGDEDDCRRMELAMMEQDAIDREDAIRKGEW